MMHGSSSPKNRTSVRSKTSVRLTKAALQAAYVVSEDLGTSLAERLFTSPRRHRRPDREREVLARGWEFSLEVELRTPRWQGELRRVQAWRWGHGPTVLLVHGWEGRGAQLGSFIEPLVRAGLSVVAFDAPGHGDSPGRRLYLTDLADCVIDVAHTVGPLHGIIAHSFGAAAVLLAHQRGNVDAKRNVMIAPSVLVGEAVAQFGRAVALDDRDCSTLAHQLASHSGLGIEALELERLVGARDAALLVVHDQGDREVPHHGAVALAAAWRQAQLRTTHGLGHRQILRNANVIEEAVAFLQHGVSPPASGLVREVDRLLDAQGT